MLHPLTWVELGSRFDLERAVSRGTLPSIYLSDDPDADLRAYTGSYLQEEVVAEGATRNIPAFGRFLRVAALANASIVNFSKVANDAQTPRSTIYEYFDVLRDTLVLFEVPRLAPVRQAQASGLLQVLFLRRRGGVGAAGPPAASRNPGVRPGRSRRGCCTS